MLIETLKIIFKFFRSIRNLYSMNQANKYSRLISLINYRFCSEFRREWRYHW